MKRISTIILTLATAAFLAACGAPAGNAPANNANSGANSNANTGKPVAAAPASKDAIIALEKSGWEGWKNNDQKAFEDLLSDRAVGFGKEGREGKAAMIKSMMDAKCDVKGYSWSDE